MSQKQPTNAEKSPTTSTKGSSANKARLDRLTQDAIRNLNENARKK